MAASSSPCLHDFSLAIATATHMGGFCVCHNRKYCSAKQLWPSNVPALNHGSKILKELIPLFTTWTQSFLHFDLLPRQAFRLYWTPNFIAMDSLGSLYSASHYCTVPRSLPWALSLSLRACTTISFSCYTSAFSAFSAAPCTALFTSVCCDHTEKVCLRRLCHPNSQLCSRNKGFVTGWLNAWLRNYRHQPLCWLPSQSSLVT